MELLHAFSGYSVRDLDTSRVFYETTLGLDVTQDWMGLQLHLPGGATVFVYAKPDHQPATYTVLNLMVADIDIAHQELSDKGVMFEQYGNDELPQDEKGIARGKAAEMGPDIAWFKDPSGNIIGLLQE